MYIYNSPRARHHQDEGDTDGGNMSTEPVSSLPRQHPLPRSQQHPASSCSAGPSSPHPASIPKSPPHILSHPTSSPHPPAEVSETSHIPPQPPPPQHDTKSTRPRGRSLPFSFPLLFFAPANASSASLAPSVAEGKPIPLDDSTTAHRTSALRQLNSSFPSPIHRHRYTKSSGAQSSTYSQPVIVRTYSGPSQSHTPNGGSRGRHYRTNSSNRGGSHRVPLPASSRGPSYLSGRPTKPAISGLGANTGAASNTSIGLGLGLGLSINTIGSGSNGSVTNTTHTSTMGGRTNKSRKSKLPLSLPWQWPPALALGGSSDPDPDEPKLPPLEAFSFKSIMADLQAQGSENDIGADLDRIAEICARSRYSLSNQYEVHVAPHGSGEPFLAGGGAPGAGGSGGASGAGRRRGHRRGTGSIGGPTLQAISDDDESNPRTHRKRRSGVRRRSAAYGTLETIMSSSRSSEEDKSKKKSAAELAEEVRGRAARKNHDHSGGNGSTTTGSGSGSGSGKGGNGGAASEGHLTTSAQASSGGRGQAELGGRKLERKKSAAFAAALMERGRRHGGQNGTGATSRAATAALLVSGPALPQTSPSHLEIRTGGAPGDVMGDESSQGSQPPTPSPEAQHSPERMEVRLAEELPHREEALQQNGGLLSGLTSWMPWNSATNGEEGLALSHCHARVRPPGHAEDKLRRLLRNADAAGGKGKSVDHHHQR